MENDFATARRINAEELQAQQNHIIEIIMALRQRIETVKSGAQCKAILDELVDIKANNTNERNIVEECVEMLQESTEKNIAVLRKLEFDLCNQVPSEIVQEHLMTINEYITQWQLVLDVDQQLLASELECYEAIDHMIVETAEQMAACDASKQLSAQCE